MIEIEKVIDKRDGEELWNECTNRIEKTRIIIEFFNEDYLCELDFFIKNNEIYFVMAEIEIEEGKPRPKLPEFLQKYLLYEVPLTDNRFSNTKLGDVNYTTQLYKELFKEESNGIKV